MASDDGVAGDVKSRLFDVADEMVVVQVAVDIRNCNILFIRKLNQRNNSHAIALPDIVVGRSPLLRSRVLS